VLICQNRNACDASEQTYWKCNVHIFQVVPCGANDFGEVFARRVTLGGHFNGFAARQILAR
jgi:hypothetical protein